VRKSNDTIIADIDWVMVIIYFLLVGLGIANIYSSVYNPEMPGLFDLRTEHGKQIMWFGIGMFCGLVIMLLESAFIKKYAYVFYGVTIGMLVVVLFMPPVNGARAWFGVGSFGIQPSEFAKLGVALALAKLLGQSKNQLLARQKSRTNLGLSNLWGLIPFISQNTEIVAIIMIPSGLILLQPDAGTFIVFTSFILVLYREGYAGNILLFLLIAVIVAVITLVVSDDTFILPLLKIKLGGKSGIVLTLLVISLIAFILIRNYVLPRNRRPLYRALLGSLVVAVLFVNFIEWGYSTILQPHQKERIDLVLGKIDDPDGKGYNIHRAKAAIGSGGFAGKGYMQATLANAHQKHVPMQSTDFIFCTWSEEWGFIGSSFLVILYTVFLVRIIIMAERQRSAFTRVYGYCVTGVLFYHFMINIGMAIGLAPVIGIPLPFFSYGGSSMLAFSLMFFILIKLDSERKTVLQ
jgi:rod shape determining protein RodA